MVMAVTAEVVGVDTVVRDISCTRARDNFSIVSRSTVVRPPPSSAARSWGKAPSQNSRLVPRLTTRVLEALINSPIYS